MVTDMMYHLAGNYFVPTLLSLLITLGLCVVALRRTKYHFRMSMYIYLLVMLVLVLLFSLLNARDDVLEDREEDSRYLQVTAMPCEVLTHQYRIF